VIHHEIHKIHKDGRPRGPFLHRVHRALISLGPWEGRVVAFVLGTLLAFLRFNSNLSTNSS
jgi:hypothetical protein